jgi:hypothetical protein
MPVRDHSSLNSCRVFATTKAISKKEDSETRTIFISDAHMFLQDVSHLSMRGLRTNEDNFRRLSKSFEFEVVAILHRQKDYSSPELHALRTIIIDRSKSKTDHLRRNSTRVSHCGTSRRCLVWQTVGCTVAGLSPSHPESFGHR